MKSKTITVTVTVNTDQLAAAFAEWRRRYEEDPEAFLVEMETRAQGPKSYGQQCAAYLLKLLQPQTT